MAHPLDRFLTAQETTFPTALAELRSGKKETHWMWFIFPQLRGIGQSSNAQRYGIAELAEADAYLSHPILGARLVECCEALLELESHSATEVLGYPDDIKLRSCLTLFLQCNAPPRQLAEVLAKYFAGHQDQPTLDLL